jgi:hypothetical protein
MTPDSLDKAKLLLELGIQTMISLWFYDWESQEKESHSNEEWEMARKIALGDVQKFLGISSEDSIKLYLGFDRELQSALNRERTFAALEYMDMFYQRFRECSTGEQIIDWSRLQFPLGAEEYRLLVNEGKYRPLGIEKSFQASWAIPLAKRAMSYAAFLYKKER